MDLIACLKVALGVVVVALAIVFVWVVLIETLTDKITDRWWK